MNSNKPAYELIPVASDVASGTSAINDADTTHRHAVTRPRHHTHRIHILIMTAMAAITLCMILNARPLAAEDSGKNVSETQTVFLPCTANEGISSIGVPNKAVPGSRQPGEERHLAFGGMETFPLRQTQNWGGFETKCILFDFNMTPITGWTIRAAYLHVALAKWDVYGAGFCSVYADWSESAVSGKQQPGAPCWNWKRTPEKAINEADWLSWEHDPNAPKPTRDNWWAWPGSKFYSVTWMHPTPRYSHAAPADIIRYADEKGRRWLKIPVSPELIHAMATGASRGMVMTDDKGQVAEAYMLDALKTKRFRYSSNFDIQVYSRFAQDVSLRPVLEVIGEKTDVTPPGKIADIRITQTDPISGTVTLQWAAPGDDGDTGTATRYIVHVKPPQDASGPGIGAPIPLYAVPPPVPAGEIQTMIAPYGTITIAAMDEAGNLGEETTLTAAAPAHKPGIRLASIPARDMAAAGYDMVTAGTGFFVNAVSDLAKPDAGSPIIDNAVIAAKQHLSYFKNPVWDASKKTVTLSAARNEVVAFQLILASIPGMKRSDKPVQFTVTLTDLVSTENPKSRIPAAKNIERFRIWYLKTGTGNATKWMPEVCVPLGGAFPDTIPFPNTANFENPAIQKNQSIWIDVYVPKDTLPGHYTGTIRISQAGTHPEDGIPAAAAELTVTLSVRELTLPDTISWPVELNTYSWIGGHFKGAHMRNDSARYILIERRYYQLAHKHRASLNIVPYSQSGRFSVATTPELDGEGKNRRVSGWMAFDGRYGPLLDGRAFTEAFGYYGPGTNTPVTQFYMPCHEDWPLAIKTYYRDFQTISNRRQMAEWAKTARLEDAFSDDYKTGYANVVSDMMTHFSKRGWTKTRFQFFLNNKYYFKCSFFGNGAYSGTSFWLLDEPINYDDYDANRFFLGLCKTGVTQSGVQNVAVQYRIDISQPWMDRGLLNDVDLWNSSWLSRVYPTALVRQKWLPNQRWWSYGGGPRIEDDGVPTIRGSLLRYTWGTIGNLPHWNNIGYRKDYNTPNTLAILYPGNYTPATGTNYEGPIASVRLKILRRAQQDIEYCALLEKQPGWNRDAVVLALADWLGERSVLRGAYTMNKLDNVTVFALRDAIAATIQSVRSREN